MCILACNIGFGLYSTIGDLMRRCKRRTEAEIIVDETKQPETGLQETTFKDQSILQEPNREKNTKKSRLKGIQNGTEYPKDEFRGNRPNIRFPNKKTELPVISNHTNKDTRTSIKNPQNLVIFPSTKLVDPRTRLNPVHVKLRNPQTSVPKKSRHVVIGGRRTPIKGASGSQ
jgi:hypothetical protein